MTISKKVALGLGFMLGSCIAAISEADARTADTVTLHCTQAKRLICETGGDCRDLDDAAANRWTFDFDLEKHTGSVERCSGNLCGPTVRVFVDSNASSDISAWDPVANDAFAFSPNRTRFTHATLSAENSKGHTVTEFGQCDR